MVTVRVYSRFVDSLAGHTMPISVDTIQVCDSYSTWAVRCPPVQVRIYKHCVA